MGGVRDLTSQVPRVNIRSDRADRIDIIGATYSVESSRQSS